jgi:hypothetical protein
VKIASSPPQVLHSLPCAMQQENQLNSISAKAMSASVLQLLNDYQVFVTQFLLAQR